MRGYGAFAWYYDELTENVSYQKRADYFLQLIEKFGEQRSNRIGFGLWNRQLIYGIGPARL